MSDLARSPAAAPPDGDEVALRLQRVSKRYGSNPAAPAALSEVSLDLPRGATALLTGPSGAGKSTLLALAACMMRPSEGRVWLAGQPADRLPEQRLTLLRREQVGLLLQSPSLLPGDTVLDNVVLPLLPQGLGWAEVRRRGNEALEAVGVPELARRRAGDLSGGEARRVALARALVGRPCLLVADEPSASLDRAALGDLVALFAALRARRQTLLIASHDPWFWDELRPDLRIHLEGGRVVAPAPC